MTEQEKLQQEIARAEGARIVYEWMRKNIRLYEPCEANAQLIGEWLKKNNFPLSEENLDKAAEAIGDRLARAIGEPVAVSAGPTLNSVAPVPAFFPKLEIPSDIHGISPERLKELRRGPHGEALKRRIDALQQGFRNPEAASAPPRLRELLRPDDGLPPIPVGADASLWPTSIADVEGMSREQFRLLFHSKKFGEAFRKRIEAIYAERGQR